MDLNSFINLKIDRIIDEKRTDVDVEDKMLEYV
jgi:hypothetical protein